MDMNSSAKQQSKQKKRGLLVMSGHARVGVPCIFGIFDHQAVVLGYLETAHSSHQFSAAE